MNRLSELVKPSVLKQPIYEPGKPTEVVARECGLDPATVVKLASNENPLGPSPEGKAAAEAALKNLHLYPENSAYFLRKRLAERIGVPADQFIVGHGSNELLTILAGLFVERGIEVVMGQNAFISYKLSTLLYGGTPVEVPLENFVHDLDAMRAAITEKTRIVYLPSLNNPTGTWNEPADIEAFARSLPEHVVLCLDEAYSEYLSEQADLRQDIAEGRPILCTRTFSKIYGLSGLRVGYGFGPPELIKLMHQLRPPFNVNSVGLAAALGAIDDDEFVAQSVASNNKGLVQVQEGLEALGFRCVPSRGNFLLAHVGNGAGFFQFLQSRGVITRPVVGYGLPEYCRISIGTEAENARMLEIAALYRKEHEPAMAAG